MQNAIPLFYIEKVYADSPELLTETIKGELRSYKAIKDREFLIKMKFLHEDFLQYHFLRFELLQDQVEKGYPPVENARAMDYSYIEPSKGSAIIKITLHTITRSNQSIPFRIKITSVPFPQNTIQLIPSHYSIMTDPITVLSKVPLKSTKKEKKDKPEHASSAPDLEQISKNIQKMMEMLQSQTQVLQRVAQTVENPPPPIDEQPLKKKIRQPEPPSFEDPFYLGLEPLQASLLNLIKEYKEVPTREKRQKRLRQLLFDLQGEGPSVIKEFAEDVLETFNNGASLPPNPPSFNMEVINSPYSNYQDHFLSGSLNHFTFDQNDF